MLFYTVIVSHFRCTNAVYSVSTEENSQIIYPTQDLTITIAIWLVSSKVRARSVEESKKIDDSKVK